MKKLYIDYNPFCVRTALVDDTELVEFSVEHSTMRGLVGNIYKGKVENVLSGMKAAFVNIGLERNGFLYVGESLVDAGRLNSGRSTTGREPAALNVSPGDIIMCQIVKDQFGMKGARLTTDVTLPGYYLVLLPKSVFIGVSRKIEDDERRSYLEDYIKALCPQNMGFIIRSAADKATDNDLKAEAEYLIDMWKRIETDYKKAEVKAIVFEEAKLLERAIRDTLYEEVDAIVVNEPSLVRHLEEMKGKAQVEIYGGERNIFKHYGIAEQLNKLTDRRVDLENGGYIIIDKTEALTVIDVNTGRYVGLKDLEDTVYRTNITAAKTIAKQLRLRNISGIVVIDFIDMQSEAHKAEVVEALRAELKKDRLKTTVVSMTSLGLVELTRKRTRLPSDNFMLQPCAECLNGYVVSNEHLVLNLRDEMIEFTLKNDCPSVIVRTSPEVFETIFATRFMWRESEGIWRRKRIYIVPDASLKHGEYDILGSSEKILSLPSESKLLT